MSTPVPPAQPGTREIELTMPTGAPPSSFPWWMLIAGAGALYLLSRR
jgi:hypothetical protein